MLIRIIAQYLESHRRLVIPQMGAFIVKEPGSSVLFSELLKRDDGVLRSLLLAQGVGEVVAEGEIDRFVFEARHAIQEGRDFPLEGLGVLKAGPNGTIAFAYAPSTGKEMPRNPETVTGLQSRAEQRPVASAAAASPAAMSSAAASAKSEPAAPAAPAAAPAENLPPRKIASGVDTLYGAAGQPAPAPVQPGRQPLDAPAQASRFQLASKKLKRDELFADSYYGRLPRRPAIEQTVRVKKRSDHFIWIALIAAAIAVAAILFGQWCDSFGREGEEIYFEQPADDMQAF